MPIYCDECKTEIHNYDEFEDHLEFHIALDILAADEAVLEQTVVF